jgi:hypothetical protein
MLAGMVPEIQAVQIPLLSAMLLGGCAAKLTRIVRVGSLDAGLGPTALFPLRLRRPIAVATCAAEFGCGVGLIVTAGAFGHGGPANAVRFLTALLFIVATCALIELRTSHPGTGCGCFGEFSRTPVSGRTLARSALLAVAALATIGLPPLHLPRPGLEAVRLGLILAAELIVIAVLSPELGEALVRLGYSEPCELRRLPAVRTLTALRRSSQWRRRAGLITADVPVDMWRELCWRYVVFPARVGRTDAEIVFAVHMRPHRPPIHAALVDAATGEVLDWPAATGRPGLLRRISVPAQRPRPGESAEPASSRGPAAGRIRPPASVFAAPTGPSGATAPGTTAPGTTAPDGAARSAHPAPTPPSTRRTLLEDTPRAPHDDILRTPLDDIPPPRLDDTPRTPDR